MNATNDITPASLNLFLALAKEAGDWNGAPLYEGNSKAERGNLTQLKVAGLLTTERDDDSDCLWVYFTDAGKALAAQHGVAL